jgi:hypothetical protein
MTNFRSSFNSNEFNIINENEIITLNQKIEEVESLITENNELGEILTLKLFGAAFASGLAIGDITVKNSSPAGLAVDSLVKVDPNTVQVRISANSSAVYATAEPTLTLVVNHDDDDGTTSALESGLKLVNNVAPLAATVVLAETSTTVLTIDFEEQVYYKNSSGTLVALADGNLSALIGVVTVVNNTTTTTLAEALTAGATGNQYSLSYVAANHTLTITMATAQASSDVVELTLLANKLFDVGGNAIATKTDDLTI